MKGGTFVLGHLQTGFHGGIGESLGTCGGWRRGVVARAVVRILTRADPPLREPERGSGSEVGELRAGMQAGRGCTGTGE